jgi:hypothetical protein
MQERGVPHGHAHGQNGQVLRAKNPPDKMMFDFQSLNGFCPFPDDTFERI